MYRYPSEAQRLNRDKYAWPSLPPMTLLTIVTAGAVGHYRRHHCHHHRRTSSHLLLVAIAAVTTITSNINVTAEVCSQTWLQSISDHTGQIPVAAGTVPASMQVLTTFPYQPPPSARDNHNVGATCPIAAPSFVLDPLHIYLHQGPCPASIGDIARSVATER